MTNYKNFGDVNLEHGFILVTEDGKNCYRILKTDFDCNSNQYLLFNLYIDITDLWIDWKELKKCCDTDLSDNIQMAIDATFFYNYMEFQCYAPLKFDTIEELETALITDYEIDFDTI